VPISHAHLRSFHAVATHGSFTRAAEMLHITQPTLSGQVKELEERYGTKLFVRHGRRIELTDIGKSAFSITRPMFRHEEEVEHLLQSARALTSGELRVAADSPYIATPLLAQFQRIYPGIQISIQYGNSQQLMSWIESRRCDVAFLPNIPQEDERLYSIPLLPDRLVVFVSQDHDWPSGVRFRSRNWSASGLFCAKKVHAHVPFSRRRSHRQGRPWLTSWKSAVAKVCEKRLQPDSASVSSPRTNCSPIRGCARCQSTMPSWHTPNTLSACRKCAHCASTTPFSK